jgi:hypothetical protein
MGVWCAAHLADIVELMWGALTFLLLFLVIDPTTRGIILTGIEEARVRLAVEAPLSYFLMVILASSAAVSALIMAWWPKKTDPHPAQVTRRYQGVADCDLHRTDLDLRLAFQAPRSMWQASLRLLPGSAILRRFIGL